MNMKKTIAAIAAGAVAVSAMATTVSAVESGTLNYNLVNTLQNQKNGKVTLKATFPNVKLVAGQPVYVQAVGMGWNDKIVVSGQYIDTNKAINPITFTRDIWSEGYSAATEDMFGNWNDKTKPVQKDWPDNTVRIPVNKINDGSPALIGGDANATEGTAGEAASVVATYNGFAVAANVDTIKANGIAAGTYTLTYQAASAAVPEVPAGWTASDASTPSASDIATLNALREANPGQPSYSIPGVPGVTYTYSAGTPAKPAKEAGFFTADGTLSAASFGITGVNGTPAAGDKIIVTYKAATEGTAGTDVVTANITVTVNMKAITDKDWENVNKKIQSGTYGIKLGNTADAGVAPSYGGNFVFGDATGSAFTAPTSYKQPYMTQINNGIDNYTNILTYIENANLLGDASDKKTYKNATAVINDAIENFETVTFTFNTAAANVRFAAATGTKTNPVINHDNINKEYNDTLKKLGTNEFIVGLYAENDWEGVDTYKAFGDHTYDWFYSPEGTGYTGMDWSGTNLFAGALVVNEGYTMSLSNTEYFDWTKTAISFDWDAIMDGAATTNNYATYVHSLKLATSQMWFWDSMDVVLVAGEADDVSADAGAEVDDDTLDDEGDDEIIADDEEDDEPVVDDEDEEPAPVAPVEEEPAPVAPNPSTGNASVALAVIPVALAAAAIVAKKRG